MVMSEFGLLFGDDVLAGGKPHGLGHGVDLRSRALGVGVRAYIVCWCVRGRRVMDLDVGVRGSGIRRGRVAACACHLCITVVVLQIESYM